MRWMYKVTRPAPFGVFQNAGKRPEEYDFHEFRGIIDPLFVYSRFCWLVHQNWVIYKKEKKQIKSAQVEVRSLYANK